MTLRKVTPPSVRAGSAPEGGLFPSGLEFNPPAHGTWNIVHIGMLVPQSHQIYICGVNCMRGVVLTAAEMGARDRFSCVVLREEDLMRGTVGEVTRQGIADVLYRLPKLPPCVIVFPVCTHHFLGVDMRLVYRSLEEEFPTVDFVRAYMDPISRKRLAPDQRLRKVMYDPLPACDPKEDRVLLLGSDIPLEPACDLRRLIRGAGLVWTDIHSCESYEEYKALSAAATVLAVYPGGEYGARRTAERLGRRYLYLPMSFSYEEIVRQSRCLCRALAIQEPDFDGEIAACEKALGDTHDLIGDAPIAIDAAAHPRPLGLARLLLEHGFPVTEIYLDAAGEEEKDLSWLRKNAPETVLYPVIQPGMRMAPRSRDRKMLAIGQKAAWFTGTPYFVNIVQGGGLWGFAGIRSMAEQMAEAWQRAKDPRDLIPRKGLGCESCI